MIKKWETIDRQKVDNFKIFDLEWVTRKHPDWNKQSKFVVLQSASWVNLIPITKEGNVLLIEQYRHGTDEVTLEIPGGLIEKDEEPRIAGERECFEETGFKGKGYAKLLGTNIPNPAFINNKCYSYVWNECEKYGHQQLDGHEDIAVVEVPLKNIRKMILEGKIQHSLVLNAFFFYFLEYSEL